MLISDKVELIETATPSVVTNIITDAFLTQTGLTANLIIIDDLVSDVELLPVVKQARTRFKMNKMIRVVNTTSLTVLFEGESDSSKYELMDLYGKNIKVFYQQLYTTVGVSQSYEEALVDPNQVNSNCFTEDEFIDYIASFNVKHSFLWVAYSAKDLANRKSEVINKEVSRATINVGDFAMFLYTSMSQLRDGFFPINGLTKDQINAAKYSLTMEDEYLTEYAAQHSLNPKSDLVKAQQVEAVVFIKGYTSAVDSYIRLSNVKWISGRDNEPVKGLIKNNSNNKGCQVYMLIINVQDPRNNNILTQLGYTV